MWRLFLLWMILAGGALAQSPPVAAAGQSLPRVTALGQSLPRVTALGQSLPRVTALGIARDGLGVSVAVRLSGPLAAPPRALPLADPLRWAIDLPAVADARLSAAGVAGVTAARAAQFDPRTVRVVIDAARPLALLGARVEAGTLVFTFAPTSDAAWRARIARRRLALPGVAEPPAASTMAAAAPPTPPPAASDSLAGIAELLRAPAGPAARPTPQLTPAPRPARSATAQTSPAQSAPAQPMVAKPAPAPPTAAQAPAAPQAPPETASPAVSPAAVGDAPAARVPRRRDGRKPLLVIDPGHGGRDVGAIATTGGYEKDVTLATARAAKRAAEADGRVRVRLTRDDDRFLTLNQRVALARQWGADLFVSVHADSAPNAQARGASVYTLSETASDAQAARLAAKENNADAVAGVSLRGQDRDVAGLLIDLAQRDSMNASVDFAAALQRSMGPRGVRFRSQFLHFAGFRVLKNVGVPAVLLESGYLSNAEDSAYLFSASGQRAVGQGIADAAVGYLVGAGQ